jgi:hypothetical protein
MRRHVVVDGSNIATEGRSTPSLAQLDQAVREFMDENPDVTITVVVDATFGHRIDPSEQKAFDEAEANAELVSPPAGAIGRGDAFVLRIADKVSGTILSNDSFQEFHGEYEWLFDEGRLVGGKPVPGVGWVFTPRTPVRGPKSREAVKEAKRKKARERAEAGHEAPGLEAAARTREAKPKTKKQVDRAIEVATDEVVEPDKAHRRRSRRRSASPPVEPLNDPTTFFDFVTAYRPGSEVEGEVDAFTSHGAFVNVGTTRCYIPLSAMSDPPPRAAKEVLRKGETRTFVIQALDPPRRGVELALPQMAHLAGAPTDETVEAEIHERPGMEEPKRGRRAKKAAPAVEPVEQAGPEAAPVEAAEAAQLAPAPRRRAKKAAPAPAPADVVQPVEAASPEPALAVGPEEPHKPAAPVTKAAKKARKAPAKKAAAKKAAPAQAALEQPTPEAPAAPVRKAAKKKAVAKKAAEPVEGAEKTAGKKVAAKKVAARKTPAKKAVAKKAPEKKAAPPAP